MRGEIVRSDGVKPGHGLQLQLQLEDDYTHNIIMKEKYMSKVEVALARYLKPPKDRKNTFPRVRLLINKHPSHVMF